MPHAYTEDQLVEQPAIGLFAALGWQTVSAMEETFGAGGTLRPRDQGRGGAGVPPARGAGAAQSRAAARGHHRRRRRTDPRPLGHEPGGGEPRGLSAAQGRHPGLRARPRARRAEDRAPARRRLGAARATTTSCWSASSASPARSTPAGRTWSASSTACRWWSSN